MSRMMRNLQVITNGQNVAPQMIAFKFFSMSTMYLGLDAEVQENNHEEHNVF